MNGSHRDDGAAAPVLSTRWPELLTAGFLMALAVLVIVDSVRAGIGWGDDGPRSGYFPFYVGALLLASSGWVAGSQLLRWRRPGGGGVFAERAQLSMVLAVLLPIVVHVALLFVLGIYVPSALLIAYFMLRYGGYRWLTLPVALLVPALFYAVFERWFLVPLPKGPLENLLGL